MPSRDIAPPSFASSSELVMLLCLKVALRERIAVLKASVANAVRQPLTLSEAERAIVERNLTGLLVELEERLPPFPERDEILQEGRAFRAYVMSSGTTP